MKPTDALNSSFIGITTLRVSGSLSAHHQEFSAIHRHWYILCWFDDHLLPGAGWSRMELQFHPAPGSKRSSNLHKTYQCRCTAKNPWWWAERLPETCRVVIPIKLEFSASVGFIHKESVTMHGHTILKICRKCLITCVDITDIHAMWEWLPEMFCHYEAVNRHQHLVRFAAKTWPTQNVTCR